MDIEYCGFFEKGKDEYCKYYIGKKPCEVDCESQCSIMESKRDMEKGSTYKKVNQRIRQVRQ